MLATICQKKKIQTTSDWQSICISLTFTKCIAVSVTLRCKRNDEQSVSCEWTEFNIACIALHTYNHMHNYQQREYHSTQCSTEQFWLCYRNHHSSYIVHWCEGMYFMVRHGDWTIIQFHPHVTWSTAELCITRHKLRDHTWHRNPAAYQLLKKHNTTWIGQTTTHKPSHPCYRHI